MRSIFLAVVCVGFMTVVVEGGRCRPLAVTFPIAAVAALSGSTDPNIKGNVSFVQLTSVNEVWVTGSVCGLEPGSFHGMHIHQYGDITGGCGSSGAHFNSLNKTHGDRTAKHRHNGDLGNIKAEGDGCAHIMFTDYVISLDPNRIQQIVLGRTLVVHALKDDLGKGNTPDSLTTGNSGARIACGVIGLAKIPEGGLGSYYPGV